MAIPLHKSTLADIQKANFNDKVINFNYSRNISKSLMSVAFYLHENGRSKDAAALILSVFRFGQNMSHGSGGNAYLITDMIGIAIQRMTTSETVWNLFRQGNFSAKDYLHYATILTELIKDQNSFKQIMLTEKHGANNIISNQLFNKEKPFKLNDGNNLEDTVLHSLIGMIPDSSINAAIQTINEEINKVYEELFHNLDKYSDQPTVMIEKLKEQALKVGKYSQPTVLGGLFSPVKTLGQVLIGIAFPNMARAWLKDFETKEKIKGTIYLMHLLAAVDQTGTWPKSREEIEKITDLAIPIDPFSKKPYHTLFKDKKLMIYSPGENMIDDQGDENKDLVFVKISLGTLGSTYSEGLWTELNNDATEKAQNIYKKNAESTTDVTTKKSANRLAQISNTNEKNLLIAHVDLQQIFNNFITDQQVRELVVKTFANNLEKHEKFLSSLPQITLISLSGKMDIASSILLVEKTKNGPSDDSIRGMSGIGFNLLNISEKFTLLIHENSINQKDEFLQKALMILNKTQVTPDKLTTVELVEAISKQLSDSLLIKISDTKKWLTTNKILLPGSDAIIAAGVTEIKLIGTTLEIFHQQSENQLTPILALLKTIATTQKITLTNKTEKLAKNQFKTSLVLPVTEKEQLNQLITNWINTGYKPAQGRARMRACYANLKVLEGATEMYNMDNPSNNLNNEQLLTRLVKDKYLKTVPECPANGKYFRNNNQWFCTTHNTHWTRLEIRINNIEKNFILNMERDNEIKIERSNNKGIAKILVKPSRIGDEKSHTITCSIQLESAPAIQLSCEENSEEWTKNDNLSLDGDALEFRCMTK
jgi:hypothetical protein